MCLNELLIKSNVKDYKVFFESNDLYLEKIANLSNSVYVIDQKVWDLYGRDELSILPQERVIIQEAVESAKNIDSVCCLYEKIMEYKPKKNLNLVSIGGGIIQDITGFVASSLYRGVNWIYIPTTFLAQIDSCIGAKTSLNFKSFKNLIGTFYPPSEIHISPRFLNTLAEEDYFSGVGEMAKLYMLDSKVSAQDFKDLLPDIITLKEDAVLTAITKCLKIKKEYIENDEFDTGKRNMLNFGHCFGHAIESATSFAIPHGLAVVVGMIIANQESMRKQLLSEESEKDIREKILLPILKFDINSLNIDINLIVEAMWQDKKNTGDGLALILIDDVHEAKKIDNMSNHEAYSALEKWLGGE